MLDRQESWVDANGVTTLPTSDLELLWSRWIRWKAWAKAAKVAVEPIPNDD